MDALLTALAQWGPMGVVCAVLFWFCISLTNKLTSIVESNTKALTELRDIISRMCDRFKE